jgi:phage terminase large subunit
LQWPPDFHAENLRRFRMMERAAGNLDLQGKVLAYYKHHPIEWMKDWCVTFDPRNEPPLPRLMPFIPFPRQAENIEWLLECIHSKTNGLEEKTRDVGATWCCVYVACHQWIFWPGSVIGFGSLKEDAVDKRGDPKSIFSKLRMNLYNLPVWMLPMSFDRRIHDAHMKLINPSNDSSITGEAGTNIGRSGRTTVFFVDEAAHLEQPEMIEAALGDNTNVRIDISSVNGSGNVFHRKRLAGEVWQPGCPMPKGKTSVFLFDWRDHPTKTQEWYDLRRSRAEAEGLLHVFAQEVDRDYLASVDNIIIKQEWVEAAIDAHVKLNIRPTTERVAGQDIADGGGDKNALAIRHGIILRHCDHWAGEAGDAPGIGRPVMIEQGVRELFYDSVGVGAGYKTGVNNLKNQGTWPQAIAVYPWSGAGDVLDPKQPIIPGDPDSPKNEDQYANLKAQSWFRLRTRFIKTFRAVRHGEKFEPVELISLDSRMPRLHELKSELSQAVHKVSGTGKTLVDKTPSGTRSPNLADSIVICYNPNTPSRGFFSA